MNFLIGFLAIVVQTIITLSHYALYKVISNYTPVPVRLHSFVFWVLIMLSFCFTLSTVFVRLYPSNASHTFYNLSAIWMGTFHFLFISTLLVAVISIFKYPTNTYQIFVLTVLLGAIAVSVYGYLNSKILRVTRYDVSLENLPTNWEGKRAVMFADSHFGAIIKEKEAKQIVEAIKNENPDIVFMSGDFYDGPKIDFAKIAEIFEDINPKYGKFFVTGNHEEYAGREETIKGIHVGSFIVTDESPVTTVDGLQIVGMPYLQNETDYNVKSFLEDLKLSSTTPTILLKHVPNNLDEVSKANISLVLSGHTHRGQVWPFMYLTNKVYKGFDYGLNNLGETQVITTSGTGTWGPPQRVGTFPEIVIITFHKK